MSNKFKAGDRVVVATLADLEEEATNWAIKDGLELNKVYLIDGVSEVDGWISLEGTGYKHPPSRFNLATEAPNVTTTPNGLLPFNYEEAIKDLSRVVTRDGRKVTALYECDSLSDGYSIISVIDKTINTHTMTGKFVASEPEPSSLDLFLKQPETVVYVNVYRDYVSNWIYNTPESAIEDGDGALYVSKVTITPTELKTETVHKY